jgi:hypothetical protein
MTNYRPISLLTSFSKVLEKAIYNRLSHHLHMSNMLVTEQHGFWNGISTEKAAFRLMNSVFQSLNKKRHVGGIFCDLTKAFDCVNHDILLSKLRFYGIRGETADWFRSYLSNRKQRVEVKSSNACNISYSNWGTVKQGFPQGSILGPILFLMYINDLPRRINTLAEPILFVDDTSVIISGSNSEEFCSMARIVLSHIIKCFGANELLLNLDKTNIVKFVTKNSPHPPLSIGYKENFIKELTSIKFLGLQIDNHLN